MGLGQGDVDVGGFENVTETSGDVKALEREGVCDWGKVDALENRWVCR